MRFGGRDNTDNRPWQLSAKLLIVSSVVTVIGFSAICASVMLDMRRGEEELARQTLDNLASSIDADISRNVELYDLSLRAVVSTSQTAKVLGVRRGKPLLYIEEIDYDRDGTPVMLSREWHVSEAFDVRVNRNANTRGTHVLPASTTA